MPLEHLFFLQKTDALIFFCIFPCQEFPKYLKKEFCISLQYLQKNVGNEVNFLSADKHESFLLVASITLSFHSQACPKYPKFIKFTMSLQYFKENMTDKVDFLPAYKHEKFLQIDTISLGVCS